jgi:hypothetical protein
MYTEDLFSPKINAAFPGVTVSEFNNRNPLGKEKKKYGNDPQPDGNSAVGRNRRNYVQVEDGNHEQQHQIAAPEGADQMGPGGLVSVGQSSASDQWSVAGGSGVLLTTEH